MDNNTLINFYDTEYIKKLDSSNNIRLERLLPYIEIEKNDVVLDVACGSGHLLDLLEDKINTYHGVDFSEDLINIANKKKKEKNIINAQFFCSDIDIYCINKINYYDKIFALDITEHIYDEMFLKIFTSLYKSLKEDGELYIHTPNAEYILEIMKKKKILKQFPSHIKVRNANEYVKLLNQAGFGTIQIKYLAHYLKPLTYFDFLKNTPIFGNFFKARLFIICKK